MTDIMQGVNDSHTAEAVASAAEDAMKRDRVRRPTDAAVVPCRCCSPHIDAAIIKGTFVCDRCATTRRSMILSMGLRSTRPSRQTADCIARGETGRASKPRCPRCREHMRHFPDGVKLGRYLKKIRKR